MLIFWSSTSRDETAIGQLKNWCGITWRHICNEDLFWLWSRALILSLQNFAILLITTDLSTMSQSGDRLKQLEEIEKVRYVFSKLFSLQIPNCIPNSARNFLRFSAGHAGDAVQKA